jgi:hypothetical protein
LVVASESAFPCAGQNAERAMQASNICLSWADLFLTTQGDARMPNLLPIKNYGQGREEQLARHWSQAVHCSKNTNISETTVFR